ncbi:hypothetical protein HAX54_010628 [Datura stramonium]|uniref:Uncharacterized protein n=1 Tax=Datura stramonium TaxID=4076 RepID=A0ABS8RWT9_DATST|nr:hypothetical protein [Datura stramonium]
MQFLANEVGPVTDALQEHNKEVVVMRKPLVLNSKIATPLQGTEPPCEETPKEMIYAQAHQTSNKCPSPSESSSNHADRCWKKVKSSSDEPRDIDLHIVEISDNYGSSSRTLTVVKESRSQIHFLGTKEHLDLVLSERDEMSRELSTFCQSLKEAKNNVKELKALKDSSKKGAEEVESKFSTAEKEYYRCTDVSLETANASDDVAKKG